MRVCLCVHLFRIILAYYTDRDFVTAEYMHVTAVQVYRLNVWINLD